MWLIAYRFESQVANKQKVFIECRQRGRVVKASGS